MSRLQRRRTGAGVLLLAALAGVFISAYAYITPLTGVTGTLGALVAILACVVLIAAALVLFKLNASGGLIALRTLIIIGLAGTFFAAMLLHQWWLGVAMVIGLIGLIVDITSSPSKPTRT
ncbi:hypothetical protein CZ787_12455 [Halomonas citrativorans]|uniref:Uncharacterized protein n=1 Tax=Halomonas citrativorans TaxID=2742612 RepID=A0A1R4I249_9GAMM|nr:hypothetical protein [Halomonas citrativorans]SJN13902.1 hypothetical protein CZ787_12455 [Halomonas citrativorans]